MAIGSFYNKRTLGLVTSTMDTLITAGSGVLMKLVVAVGATARYVKLYDLARAPASTDTPVMTVYVPAAVTYQLDFGPGGLPFVNGLGYRQSTGGADNDTGTTSFAAADSAVHAFWQAMS